MTANHKNHTPAVMGVSHQFRDRLAIVTMGLLSIVLVLHLFRQFSSILQQLLIAAFIGYAIMPLHRWLVRRGIAPWLSGVLLVCVFVGASYGLGQAIYGSLADLSTSVPRYRENLSRLIERAAGRIPGVDRRFLQQVIVGQSGSMESAVDMIRSALGSFFSFLTQMAVVIVYLVFLVAEQVSFHRRIEAAFEPPVAARIMGVVGRINDSIVQYIAVKTLMSLLSGVLTMIVLACFGVNYVVLWGILAFLLNYIPYLGSLGATAFPVLLALVDSPSPLKALNVLIALCVVQMAIAYAIEPMDRRQTPEPQPADDHPRVGFRQQHLGYRRHDPGRATGRGDQGRPGEHRRDALRRQHDVQRPEGTCPPPGRYAQGRVHTQSQISVKQISPLRI